MLKKMTLLGILCFAVVATAEEPAQKKIERTREDELMQAMREKMQKDHAMIEKLLNEGALSGMHKEMHENFKKLLDNFYQGDMDNFFGEKNFDRFFKQWQPHNYLDNGEEQWLETPQERILILKIEMTKDMPVDIQIAKGVIKISGTFENKNNAVQQKSSFQKVFTVPGDCDEASAQFENAEGKIQIKFKKKVAGAPKKLLKKVKPLSPGKGDINL